MDIPKTWIADFIITSLDAWFAELQTRSRSLEYRFKKIDVTLKAQHRCDFVVHGRLVKLPNTSSAEPRGLLSDGNHNIEVIFRKTTAISLQSTGIGKGALLRIANPGLRVSGHLNPPTAQLEVESCNVLQSGNEVEAESCDILGTVLLKDEAIRKRLLEYCDVKTRTCPSNMSTPKGSPRSTTAEFRSQPSESPHRQALRVSVARSDDGDLSQAVFATQAAYNLPNPSSRHSPRTKARGPLLGSQERRDGRQPTAIETLGASRPRNMLGTHSVSLQLPAQQDVISSIQVSNESRLAPPVVLSELQTNLQVIARNALLDDEVAKSSPIEVSELAGDVHSPEVPTRSAERKIPASAHTPRAKFSRSDISKPSTRPLSRWQEHRYIPRHACKIPKDQLGLLEDLLNKDDSWQPPLVGRPRLAGQVPLALMEEYINAADRNAGNPSINNGNATALAPQQPETGGVAQPEIASPTTSVEESSSGKGIEWSQSPPTQVRRAQTVSNKEKDNHDEETSSEDLSPTPSPRQKVHALPQSSPLAEDRPPKRVRRSCESPNDEESLTKTRTKLSANSSSSQGDEECITQSKSPSGQLHSTPSSAEVARTPPAASTPALQQSPRNSPLATARSRILSTEPVHVESATKIQVKHTPYPGKKAPVRSLLYKNTAEPHADSTAIEPKSTFIPATYTSQISNHVPQHSPQPKMQVRPATSQFEAVGDASRTSARAPNENADSLEATQLDESHVKDVPGSGIEVLEKSTPIPLGEETSKQQRQMPESNNPVTAPVSEHPEIADLPMIDVSMLTDMTNHQIPTRTSSEETNDGVEAMKNAPKKRRRTQSATQETHKRQRRTIISPTNDEQYADLDNRRRHERSELLSRISKANPATRKDSSSVMEIDSASDILQSSRDGIEIPTTSHLLASRGSSTPITRNSAYGALHNADPKAQPPEAVSTSAQDATSVVSDMQNLFSIYKRAYPDYEGDSDDFMLSFLTLKRILRQDARKIHPSLRDDAIFHHLHSYLPYEQRCKTPRIDFVDYFNEFVDEPCHLKRIVTKQLPTHTIPAMVTLEASRAGPISTKVPPKAPPSLAAKLTDRDSRQKQVQRAENLSQESRESIEKWLKGDFRGHGTSDQNSRHKGSPELGSANVDQMAGSRQSLPEPMPIEVAQVSSQSPLVGKSHPVPKLAAAAMVDVKSEKEIQVPPSATPVHGSFVKPRRPPTGLTPAASMEVTPASSQASTPFTTQKLWKGTNTFFVQMALNHEKEVEKQKKREEHRRRSSSTARKSLAAADDGIDIFKWRKK